MGVLYVKDAGVWTPIGQSGPTRIAYAVSNALDQTQGSTPSWRQLSFTLASQRLIKVEAFAEYSQITAASNSSAYVQLGVDGGRNVRVLIAYNTPLSQNVTGTAALWQVCAAGTHTAELFVANNSTVGAMRFASGQAGAWISVSDWGPA